jgi:peptide/nickel transport system substrate-binding protein
MKRLLLTLLVLLASVAILIGCGQPETTPTPSPTPTPTPSPTPTKTTTPTPSLTPTTSLTPTPTTTPSEDYKYGGTLRVMLIAGPQTPGGWPPEVFGPDATSYQFCYDSFLRSDNNGGVYPWLAETYEVADDLTSITFKLREDVKFHDGTIFNAEAAKWNLENHITAMSSYSQYWASVDIVDDYTIRVNLRMWTNTALNSFADSAGTWMVSPTAFQANGVDWMRNNPVGTGPFKFESFHRDVGYNVVRNPDYWIEARPYLDAIEIMYVADPLTQKAAMQAGEADMLELEPSKMAKDLEAAGLFVDFQIVTVYSFLPDSAHPDSPYANQLVREAVDYAIDRQSLANGFSYGYWEAPYQLIPPSNAAYNPDFAYARVYNVEQARQLLEDAGYGAGFDTTILVNPAIIDRNIPVALQSNLEAIGIHAELSFPANMGGFIGDSNSLNNVLVIQPVLSSANYNATFMFFMGKDFIWNKNFLPPPEFLELREVSLTSPTMDVELIRAACDELSKVAAAIPLMLAGLGWAKQPTIIGGGFFERGSGSLFAAEEVWIQ